MNKFNNFSKKHNKVAWETGETKQHYKLIKSKKGWLTIALGVTFASMSIFGVNNVSADVQTNKPVTQVEPVKSNNESGTKQVANQSDVQNHNDQQASNVDTNDSDVKNNDVTKTDNNDAQVDNQTKTNDEQDNSNKGNNSSSNNDPTESKNDTDKDASKVDTSNENKSAENNNQVNKTQNNNAVKNNDQSSFKSQDDNQQGVWGNVNWSYNNNGVLTFYGSNNGDTATLGQDSNNDPIRKFKNDITRIVITQEIFAPANSDNLLSDMPNLQEIIGLNKLRTDNTTSMYKMFWQDEKLKSVDLSNFNTSKVTSMQSMFSDCDTLTELDFSSFDTHNVTSMKYMIFSSYGSSNLRTIVFGENFDTTNASLKEFGDGTNYLSKIIVKGNKTNLSGAHIRTYGAHIRTYKDEGWNFNNPNDNFFDGGQDSLSDINNKLIKGTYTWAGEPQNHKDGDQQAEGIIKIVDDQGNTISICHATWPKGQAYKNIPLPKGFVAMDGSNTYTISSWQAGENIINVKPDPKNPQKESDYTIHYKNGNGEVGSETITGYAGTSHTIKIPTGYELTGNNDLVVKNDDGTYTIVIGGMNKNIDVSVQGN